MVCAFKVTNASIRHKTHAFPAPQHPGTRENAVICALLGFKFTLDPPIATCTLVGTVMHQKVYFVTRPREQGAVHKGQDSFINTDIYMYVYRDNAVCATTLQRGVGNQATHGTMCAVSVTIDTI